MNLDEVIKAAIPRRPPNKAGGRRQRIDGSTQVTPTATLPKLADSSLAEIVGRSSSGLADVATLADFSAPCARFLTAGFNECLEAVKISTHA
jgi:hypothetical protein